MAKKFDRRDVLRAGAALYLASIVPAARACEYFSSTLRIFHPWTRATPQEAGVAPVCMSFTDVVVSDRLVGVQTPLTERVEMFLDGDVISPDIPIPAGRETVLGEYGSGVRLVGLTQSLEVGRSYPLKLVFEKGGVVDATLNVDYLRFK